MARCDTLLRVKHILDFVIPVILHIKHRISEFTTTIPIVVFFHIICLYFLFYKWEWGQRQSCLFPDKSPNIIDGFSQILVCKFYCRKLFHIICLDQNNTNLENYWVERDLFLWHLFPEAARSHSTTLDSVGFLWKRDRAVAGTSTSRHTTFTKESPPAVGGFEPTTPQSEGPRTYALDRAAMRQAIQILVSLSVRSCNSL